MKFTGKVWKYGDDMDTDLIIPARYLNTSDPDILEGHCMEDADSEFISKIQRGDIIVGGKNFGCGSSREHAPDCHQGVGDLLRDREEFCTHFLPECIQHGIADFRISRLVGQRFRR